MAYWLFKTEAETFSWDEQKARGVKGEPWSGVRNHQAKLNMMKMKKGDRGFFYHSGEERQIVGVVEVAKEHYPDHTDATGKFGMVDVKAVMPVKTPVTLAAIKADPRLKDMLLVRHSRLSVSPVGEEHWKIICEMAGIKP